MRQDINAEIADIAYEHLLSRDSVLAPVLMQVGPCRLRVQRRHYFDILASSIIGQQLSEKAADKIRSRVCGLAHSAGALRPEHIKSCSPISLRGAGLSEAKARYVLHLAETVISGGVSFRKLRSLGNEEVIETLTVLPGIGRWTAEMFLIFALGRLDVFSEGDAALRRALALLYGRGKRLSDKSVQRITSAWSPYRSIGSWYLWRTLD